MFHKLLKMSYKILLFTLIFFYYFASRTILYFLFLLAAVHFVANSSHFRLSLEKMLRSIVPGSFKFEKIQIAPYLFNTDILGVSVSLPDGREIITAGYIGTNLNLVKFLSFGKELLFSDRKGALLEIDLKRIDLHDFKADLEFDEKGEFVFLSAFVPPETEEPEPAAAGEEPSVKVKVSLNNIEGFQGYAVVRFPRWGISVDGISLKTKVAIKENGGVEVTAREVSFSSGGFFFKPLEEAEFPLPLNIPFGDSKVENFRLNDDGFTFGKADILVSKSRVTAEGGMAFPANAEPSFTGSAKIEIPPEEPLLYRLANLSVISPLKVELRGAGTFSDITVRANLLADSLGFEGIPFSNVLLDASIKKEEEEKSPARGKYRVDVAKFSFFSNAGEFSLKDTVIYPFGDVGDRELIFKGRFDFSNLLLPALLKTAFKIDKTGDIPVSTLEGVVDFTGEISGKGGERTIHIETGFGIDGNVRKDLSYFDGNKVHLKGNLRLEKPLKGGVSKLTVSNFSFSSGRDSLTFKGLIIPEDKSIYGRFYIRKLLEPLTSRLASVAVPAEIVVNNGAISGSLLNPGASGDLSVRELSFGGFEISNAEAKITLKDWVLGFKGLKCSTNIGGFYAYGSIKIFDQGDPAKPALSLSANNFTAEKLRLEKITGGDLKGEFSLKGKSIGASLARFVETFSGSFEISSPYVEYKDLKFNEFSASVKLTGERMSVESFSIKSEKGGIISGKFEASRDFKQSNFKISLVDLDLGALFERDNIPLYGTVSLDLTAGGELKNLHMDGTLSINDFRYDKIKLGSAVITISKEADGNLMLSSNNFFERMRLNPESSVKFAGGVPDSAVILVDLNKLKINEIIPEYKVKGMLGHLSGSIGISLSFSGEKRDRFRISLTVPDGGFMLSLVGGEVKYKNSGKAFIEIGSEKIQVKGLRLSDGKHELGICGAYYHEHKVAFNISGSLGLEFLKMAKTIFASAEGHFSTLSGNTGKQLPECAAGPEGSPEIPEGLLVFGMVSDPFFYGALTLEDASFTFRQFNQEVTIKNGSKFMLEKPFEGESGFNIIIPKRSKVTGYIGEGEFSLFGSLTMISFKPDSGDIFFEGSDITYAAPHEFNMTVTPKINLLWSDATNPGKRKIKLSGSVNINNGRFYKNFDLLNKAFSGAVEREVTRTSPPITESIPMFAEIELDLKVTGNNFNINSRLPFGSTDMDTQLDLKVVGTLGDPKFYNRIQLMPGGRLVYGMVKREFEIQKGTVDFNGDPQKPTIDIEAKTEIEQTSISGRSGDFKGGGSEATETTLDILITLNITGTYPDLKIDLTSNHKEYDQTDLQMLILTGMTKKDISGGGGTQTTADSSINILTEDFTNILSKMFLSSLVDAVSFGVDYTGGVNAEVLTHLGKHMKIKTKVAEETIGRRYSAGFQLKITDRLFLEGKIKGFEPGVSGTDSSRQYESKLRYRIPLD